MLRVSISTLTSQRYEVRVAFRLALYLPIFFVLFFLFRDRGGFLGIEVDEFALLLEPSPPVDREDVSALSASVCACSIRCKASIADTYRRDTRNRLCSASSRIPFKCPILIAVGQSMSKRIASKIEDNRFSFAVSTTKAAANSLQIP